MHICKTIVTMKSPPIQSCDPTLLDLPFSALSLHAVQQMTDCLPAAFEKSERAVHVPRSQPDLCWCTPRLLPNLVEIQHHVLSDGVLHPAGQGALLESVFAVNRNPSPLTTPVVCVNGCPTLSISKSPVPRPRPHCIVGFSRSNHSLVFIIQITAIRIGFSAPPPIKVHEASCPLRADAFLDVWLRQPGLLASLLLGL